MGRTDRLKYAFGALSEAEHDLLLMWRPYAIRTIRKEMGLSPTEAKVYIKGIEDKLRAYQEHEARQEQRSAALNTARINMVVDGLDELVVGSFLNYEL